MAALALRQTQSILRILPFGRWQAPAFAVPSLAAPSTSWSLPSLDSLLDLLPPFLLAVPKSKTSHSRKAMRSANKGLKDKRNITNCAGCGSVKLAHNICPNCYSAVTRAWKAKNKDVPDLS
ncbi:putative 54S ribosomal protein L32, mitochondrial [Psilocybe cubensis]|uniref:54S ribosomal protein L32, mitochondrial n=2 Tax=Psilocybe cubensis TaxID=181762 RepID=A0ACB8HGT3_PSICU|nr:putative 54S ribosomal protein L32, mitochondrial [Psilocybe cubensis]KAH9486899.1 putative 54S ribosomal protein L32, mitochondrial [Psilocybe cubensis]